MQINLKTSEANLEVVRKLTLKLPTGTKENVIARIALSFSLSTGKKFTPAEFGVYDSKGKEYKDHILFDSQYRGLYIGMICQHYNIYKTHEDIPKYIKHHIDHGLEQLDDLFEKNPDYSFFDFLGEYLEKGISSLESSEVSLDHVKNFNQGLEKGAFTGQLVIEVGKSKLNGNPIHLNLNDTLLHNNAHIAVAGNSGTGKTQFALEFLRQIVKATGGQVNFVYLDFKGLKKEDLPFYEGFFKDTHCDFIDVPEKPFPLNPLSFIDNVNQKNQIMGINKFVDIISRYSNIGKRQEQVLKDAVRMAFAEQKNGEYPGMSDIYEYVEEIYGDKRDTLTEVVESMAELEIFEKKVRQKASFLNQNNYFSLSGNLSDSLRFTAVFLIINYIYNTFMNMESPPVEKNFQGMRYVLLIDEAHVIFKDKKSQDILEKVLREIRSKGVSVVLLSQGIAEFNQPNFDFSSMCETSFLLDIKDKANRKNIQKFLGIGETEWPKVAKAMEEIEKGEAISNMKEMKVGDLFELSQFNK